MELKLRRSLFLFLLIPLSGTWGQKLFRLDRPDELYSSVINGQRVDRLLGNVKVTQGDVKLFCDSAWIIQRRYIRAYGKVHVQQGDTLNMYCDSMYVDSKLKKFDLYSKVRVLSPEYRITTDSLHYSGMDGVGKYLAGAVIVSDVHKFRLTSVKGYYRPKLHLFHFKKDVHVRGEGYEIFGDTLSFDHKRDVSRFYGPTRILLDSTEIQCTGGFYMMEADTGKFTGPGRIFRPDQYIQADTLMFSRANQRYLGLGNVLVYDSLENIELTGQRMFTDEKKDSSLLTVGARVRFFESDDTLRLLADTILNIGDSGLMNMQAFPAVTFFRSDIQGIADSASYRERDSTLLLFQDPVLWNGENQVTSDTIRMLLSGGKPHRAYFRGHAFVVSQVDSVDYNQVKGHNMLGYFREGKMHRVDVTGNGQTVYFPTDDETEEKTGMNRIFCGEMVVRFVGGEVKRISFLNQPDGAYYDVGGFNPKERYLEGFDWRESERPAAEPSL